MIGNLGSIGGPASVPKPWLSAAMVGGLGILGWLLMRGDSDYRQMHRVLFGIEPLEEPPLYRIPDVWVRDRVLFGWIDRWAREVGAEVYFRFHPADRARWADLAERYGRGRHRPSPPLPTLLRQTGRELARRSRLAWTVFTKGTTYAPSQR